MGTKKNDPCRDKAATDETLFTIRSQDETGDMVVDLWGNLQRFIAARIAQGYTKDEALLIARRLVANTFGYANLGPITMKIRGAYTCAGEMRAWPNRKLPD